MLQAAGGCRTFLICNKSLYDPENCKMLTEPFVCRSDKAGKMHVINICTCANLVFWVLAVKVLCNNNDLSAVQTFFVIQTTVGRRKNMYFNNEGFRRIQLKPALDNLICIMNWKS